MSVLSTRRTDDLDAEFKVQRSRFKKWRGDKDPLAYRVTAIPLDNLPDPGRLFNPASMGHHFALNRFSAWRGSQKELLVLVAGAWSERPILRGVEAETTTASGRFRMQHYQSGSIELSFAHSGLNLAESGALILYHGWVLGGVANVLQMVTAHCKRVGLGDAEFGVEVEISPLDHPLDVPFAYADLGNTMFGDNIHSLPPGPILLPLVSVRGSKDFDAALNTIDTDIFDALRVRRIQQNPLIVFGEAPIPK